MPMTVLNNNAAAMALGELNKNNNKISNDLKKVATGANINTPKDGAAEFAQSEKMRALVRSLNQDIENSQKGMNLVKTAEGGIQGIVDSLRTMKELALNSLNGHNTDEDRKILQKEFSSRMENIEDLASTTNYDGIVLLDGRWKRDERYDFVTHTRIETDTEYVTVTEPYTETITTYEEETEEYTETEIVYEEVTEEYPYTYTVTTKKQPESKAVRPSPAVPTGVTEPGVSYVDGQPLVTPPTLIPVNRNYTITTDGAYMIPQDYTGTLNIQAKNVELLRENESEPLKDVYIRTSSEGNTNLWINNLDFNNKSTSSFIRFQGNNNVLTLKGNNNMNLFGDYYDKALIHVGKGLTIEGSGTLTFTECNKITGESGALIGSDAYEASIADIIINSGTIVSKSVKEMPYGTSFGAGIGSGSYGSIGNIIINGGTINLTLGGGSACIGAGGDGTVGNISIQDATITAHCDDGACIGSGNASFRSSSSAGDIYILNSTLNLTNTHIAHTGVEPRGYGAGIGGGVADVDGTTSVGDITVENSTVVAVTDYGACIGTGSAREKDYGYGEPYANGISVINSTLDLTVLNSRAQKIGRGVRGIIPLETVEEEVTEMRTRTVQVPREVTKTYTRTVIVPHETKVEKTRTITVPRAVSKTVEYQEKVKITKAPLIIHTGPKSNLNLSIFINDMRTKAMGLEDAAVDPLEKAREALKKLDSAVEYAINENERMGAYQQRLIMTVDNLVTALTNTINSESVIRDADMAKAMMIYAKHNVLANASQAMLSQANKGASSVLGLLQ